MKKAGLKEMHFRFFYEGSKVMVNLMNGCQVMVRMETGNLSGRELEGKAAVVTGGSRGIGKAVAEAFLKRGAKVAIASRTEAEVEAATQELANAGEIIGVRADVSNSRDVETLFAKARGKIGTIDILVNCAGIQKPIGGLRM